MVIPGAEVREKEVLRHAIVSVANKPPDCGVRQMSVSPHKPLFERPRIRADTQHLQIVVGFEDQDMRTCKPVPDIVRKMSDVRQLGYLYATAHDAEGDGIACIVWNSKWDDLRVAYHKGSTGLDRQKPGSIQ